MQNLKAGMKLINYIDMISILFFLISLYILICNFIYDEIKKNGNILKYNNAYQYTKKVIDYYDRKLIKFYLILILSFLWWASRL